MEIKLITTLATVFSFATIFACLVVVPYIWYEVQDIRGEIDREMAEFRVLASDSWKQMREMGGDRELRRQAREAYAAMPSPRPHPYHQPIRDEPPIPAKPKCNCNARNNCPAGAAGPKGRTGETGRDGLAGLDGHDGRPAQDVSAVMQANRGCITCPAGRRGPPGSMGSRGKGGLQGAMGRQGSPGMPGRPGPHGENGDAGERGAPGFDGQPGVQGDSITIEQPMNGPPGTPGEPGDRGDAGQPGEDAYDGARGFPGEPGHRGHPGRDMVQGLPGRPGYPGVPGDDAQYCNCPKRNRIRTPTFVQGRPEPARPEPARPKPVHERTWPVAPIRTNRPVIAADAAATAYANKPVHRVWNNPLPAVPARRIPVRINHYAARKPIVFANPPVLIPIAPPTTYHTNRRQKP